MLESKVLNFNPPIISLWNERRGRMCVESHVASGHLGSICYNSFRWKGHSMSNHPMVETVPAQILMKIYTFGLYGRKEDLPNNSVFGKVLSEIWAIKVLLKQPKLARPPHKKPATTPNIQDIDE